MIGGEGVDGGVKADGDGEEDEGEGEMDMEMEREKEREREREGRVRRAVVGRRWGREGWEPCGKRRRKAKERPPKRR